MAVLNDLYKSSLTLLTDLYQLTMAYGYWQQGMADHEAVFHLFFRKNPFKGGYTVACGLQTVVEFLERFAFDDSDVAFLAEQTGNDGKPLFEAGFLQYLKEMKLTCHVDGVPEGTVVFPHEPLLRITGPLIQCQLLETALLNIVNFQTLIATKAARTVQSAKGDPVLEFGLRRAQGIDGALSASRAAYVGGCASTSNVLAGKLFGIPIKGTHAHSWVMSFDTEMEAFEHYAAAMPNNCVFLVDTYDTLQGVRHAVEVGRRLREQGHEMIGVRLDSGDLAYLSIEARKILDAGGFPKAAIVASNDLDENLIKSLKDQGATISIWGVGTNLVTAADQPALGGVYKLSAIRSPGGAWKYRVKLSEQLIKVSNPGIQQVRRFKSHDLAAADMIYDIEHPPSGEFTVVDPMDTTRRKHLPADTPYEDLLVPVYRKGERVYDLPTVAEIRTRAQSQLQHFHSGIRRFDNPHQYPVGLEAGLFDRKMDLVLKARGESK
jgi:nicotinate phosphoribosyltransferase